MLERILTAIAMEPARFATRTVAICAAIFAVLVAFGVEVTQTQVAAVSGLVAVLAAGAGEFIRSVVVPMPKVGELVKAQASERVSVIPPLPPLPRAPKPPDPPEAA